MLKSDVLLNQKAQYIKCKNNATEVAKNLNNARNELLEMVKVQTKGYKVDETSPFVNYTNSTIQKINNIYNNLVNNIIPGTNVLIKNLNYQIEDAKQEEFLKDKE